MDVASRQKLDDVLIRTKFSSLRWTTDNKGIFYATYAGALNNDKPTEENNVTTFSSFLYRIHFSFFLF